MNNLIEIDFKPETADDYLVGPFLDNVNDKDFVFTTNVMKILVGVTGQGKTYNTAKTFIPHLAKTKGVEMFVVSVPTTEILDKSDFVKSAASAGLQHTTDIKSAIQMLKMGVGVLLTTTHQSFVVADKGKQLQEYLKTSGKTFAVFIDEAHTWLVSDVENYKDVNGHYGTNYEATMFKSLAELSTVSPYIFGLTATPNGEQLGYVPPLGNMKFEVINSLPPKKLLMGKTAYVNGVKVYNQEWFTDNKFGINELYQDAIVKLFMSETKKTMMVSVGNVCAKTGYNLNYVKMITQNAIHSNALAPDDEKTFAIMTGDKKVTGVYAVNGSFEVMDEDDIKEKLNDLNDPLKIVIVVQKGTMGMNIYTLKSLVSFKPQEKMDKSGNSLTEFAIQTLGRLVRLNPGMPIAEFTEKYGYDLGEYIKTLNDEEIQKLLIANSFDILVPSTDMWMEAITKFKSNYVSTIQQAKAYYTK